MLKNTPFYRSKLGIKTILSIINLWSVNVKYKAIAEFLEIGIKSVRKVIYSTIKSTEESVYIKIGGPGVVVEIDESKFGKVTYHRGHRIRGVWVFGMVKRTLERIILFVPVA